MNYYTLAVTTSGHDASVCLMRDDKVILLFASERVQRKKHIGEVSVRDFKVVKGYTSTIHKLVLANTNSGRTHLKNKELISNICKMLTTVGINYPQPIIDNDNHHLFHAVGSFYPLGLNEAVCVVVDGVGSSFTIEDKAMFSEVTSFFYANDSVETIYKLFFYRHKIAEVVPGFSHRKIQELANNYPFKVDISPHIDAGKMYGTITRTVGFHSVEAGKTMGLSAYGKPNNLPPILIEGKALTNSNLFRSDSHINTFCYPEMVSLSEKDKANLAYNAQKAFEILYLDKVSKALAMKPECKNLVLSGGCALNILGNSLVKKTFPHINVYAEPIGTDVVQSLGAALYYYKKEFPQTKYSKFDVLYLGPEYSIVDTKDKLLKLVEQHNNEFNLPV